MEAPCPACGKSNDLSAPGACLRCGCDLGALAGILTGALWQLKAAARELRTGNWEAAFEHAEQSWSLRHSPRAARLASLAIMALGRSRDALQWMRRAENCK
jgi:hypothetical protein